MRYLVYIRYLWIKPKAGFNKDVIKELISTTKQYVGIQRYIALLLDEMKIQCNLIFDKQTNELVGFVDRPW
jgi:hypothetical protein